MEPRRPRRFLAVAEELVEKNLASKLTEKRGKC
jgi:hypothetical protein